MKLLLQKTKISTIHFEPWEEANIITSHLHFLYILYNISQITTVSTNERSIIECKILAS